MSELFSTYESDFQISYQDATSKLAQVPSLNGQERKRVLKAVENATDECLELLEQMSIEVQNIPSTERAPYNTKVRQYRAQVDQSKGRLKDFLDDQDRNELFGSRYTDNEAGVVDDETHDAQRKKLLSNNASLERTSERLRDSQRIAIETESVGGNILNDLRAQREQILGSRNTLLAADNYVDRSVKTLKSMSRRLTANKFISYAIIAVLILLILLVLISNFS